MLRRRRGPELVRGRHDKLHAECEGTRCVLLNVLQQAADASGAARAECCTLKLQNKLLAYREASEEQHCNRLPPQRVQRAR